MRTCECGCGNQTAGGDFLPGHDQTLRVDLESRVGGLLAMRNLVTAMETYIQGETTLEDLGKVVRRAFSGQRRDGRGEG